MATHVFKTENEDIIVQETIDGVGDRQAFENALVEMQLYTAQTRGNTGIFHVAISPREHESLTPEQQTRAVEMIEEKFGLTGQLRQRIDHVKEGRAHAHVFWSTVDQENEKLIPLPLYKRKLQECANDMTQEFGLEPVHRRPNENTIEVTNADRMIEGRSKEKGKREKAQDRKVEVTAIWDRTETGEAFLEGLRDAGYDVAKGEKARFILLDRNGNTFNLARDLPRLVKVKNLGERFGALEQELQSVQDVQELRKQRQEYDREQAEIDRQNKELDAADEAAKTKKDNVLYLDRKKAGEKTEDKDLRGEFEQQRIANDNEEIDLKSTIDSIKEDGGLRHAIANQLEQERRFKLIDWDREQGSTRVNKKAMLHDLHGVADLKADLRDLEKSIAEKKKQKGLERLFNDTKQDERERKALLERIQNKEALIDEELGVLDSEIEKQRLDYIAKLEERSVEDVLQDLKKQEGIERNRTIDNPSLDKANDIDRHQDYGPS